MLPEMRVDVGRREIAPVTSANDVTNDRISREKENAWYQSPFLGFLYLKQGRDFTQRLGNEKEKTLPNAFHLASLLFSV